MPDLYAVVGNPIAHSKSPQIHAAFARATGQDMDYVHLLAPLHGFADTLARFAAEGGRGCNVTMPFKEQAFALSTRLAERAAIAGAVNTLAREGNGWRGDTTDGAGLVADLLRNQAVGIAGRRVLVLGAGGAVRGILQPILAERPGRLVVANRTVERARALTEVFARYGRVEACATGDLADRFDLVINAAPAEAAALSSLPATLLDEGAFAYDLVYADQPTPFVRWAREHGAAGSADGLGMLVEQAAESFWLWRGIRPDTGPLFKLLRP